MKATVETKRKDLANGHYLILEREVRTTKGVKKVTPWHVEYNSQVGY